MTALTSPRRTRIFVAAWLIVCASTTVCGEASSSNTSRPTARELGIAIGSLTPGPHNAITDVAGVAVGHATLHTDDGVHTGATAIVPHNGNLFRDKVPAAIEVGNGFGKLIGSTQVMELGQLETPIVLTNTLAVWDAANVLVDRTLEHPDNADVRSVNPVVGETNDGYLSDIRRRALTAEHFVTALTSATTGPVQQGAVGAGTGTRAFGYKGGIGSSSRRLPEADGGHTVGVLVQTNYGGSLIIDGLAVPAPSVPAPSSKAQRGDGSCMIIVATDAPLDARQLGRVARRALAGMARTGASFSHGSGDYVIAFSTAESVRISGTGDDVSPAALVPDARLSALFVATADATEEAIINSLLLAETVTGFQGRTLPALPIEPLRRGLAARGGG